MNDTVAYLESFTNLTASNSDWHICDCPICGKRSKFHVSDKTGQCGCFVCGWSGNFITLVSTLENIPRAEAAKRQTSVNQLPRFIEKDAEVHSRYEYFSEIKKVFDESYIVSNSSEAMRYLDSRQVTYEDVFFYRLKEAPIKPFKFKYAKDLVDFSSRIIIPVFENNNLVYIQARSYVDTPKKVLNLPSYSSMHVGKSNWVFNLDSIPIHEDLIITEGPFDSMRVGRNAVSIFGKVISDVQLRKILKKRPSSVTVWLDSDAHANIMTIADKFSKYVDTYIILQKEGDPGDLTDNEVDHHLKSKEQFNNIFHKIPKKEFKMVESSVTNRAMISRNLQMIGSLCVS